MAGGASFMAAPAIVAAQTPLKVSFVQQRGLLYLPVDMIGLGHADAVAARRILPCIAALQANSRRRVSRSPFAFTPAPEQAIGNADALP
jgi:hypothetical protein